MKSTSQRILRFTMAVAMVTVALARGSGLERLLKLRHSVQRRLRRGQVFSQALPPEEAIPPGDDSAMARLHRRTARLANQADETFDRLKTRWGERLGGDDDTAITIAPYRGYGAASRVYIKGRVLLDQGISPAADTDSVWRNLRNTYKRFESDEIAGARLRARLYGQEQEGTTDEEGYFEFWFEPQSPLPTDRLWHEVELEVLSPVRPGHAPVHKTGYVLVAPPSARFGIISDVDDTVVHTNATSLLKMLRTVFFSNARTRVPFEGVAAFYEALQGGVQGNEFNPLFYVSSSPWNLYELLTEFLEVQDIPVGPLMLRDWGISNEEVLPNKHGPHKLKSIRQIMDTFPALPFILIGDSGQEDPEIYYDVLKSYPNRVLAIYIRNVSRDTLRPDAIQRLAQEVAKAGSTLLLADDTLTAAQHAASQGWISPTALPRVKARKEADEGTPEEEAREERPSILIDGTPNASEEPHA